MRLKGGSRKAGTKFRQRSAFDKCIEAFGNAAVYGNGLPGLQLHAHLRAR